MDPEWISAAQGLDLPDGERAEPLGAHNPAPGAPASTVSPAEPPPIMLGRLAARLHSWEAITTDRFVLSVVGHGGYRLDFKPSGPPPRLRKANQASCEEHHAFVSDAVSEALAMGVVAKVPEDSLHLILPLGVVASSPTKLRLVYDASRLNKTIVDKRFKFENLGVQGRTVFEGASHGWCLDLFKAFYHLEISAEHRKYMGFEWQGDFYHWQCMAFGYKLAPWLLSRCMKAVTKYWRSEFGLNILQMMDDVSGSAISARQARTQVRFAVHHLERLGFLVQHSKTRGDAEPVTRLLVLGVDVDFEKQLFCTSEKRKKAISLALGKILRIQNERPRVPVRWIARIAGLLCASTISLGPNVRVRSRDMHVCINSRLMPGEDSRDKSTWNRIVTVSPAALAELRWWATRLEDIDGRPIRTQHPTLSLDGLSGTDAGARGFGGWLKTPPGISKALVRNILANAPHGFTLAAATRQGMEGLEFTGLFPGWIASGSSTLREMFAVRELVRIFKDLLAGLTIQLQLDNQGCVQILGGTLPQYSEDRVFGGSRKPQIQALAIELLDDLEEVNAKMLPQWVPRELNVRADWLSHARELGFWGQYDYKLDRFTFEHLDRLYGPHTIDRMASAETTQLARYNSLWFDTSTEWVNCFAVPWGGENNYIFPPPALTAQVLSHMRDHKAVGTIVVLDWGNATFWPKLYPNGKSKDPAPFVHSVVPLGDSRTLLAYPEGCLDPLDDVASHLPIGQLLAFRVDMSYL